LNNNNNNNNVVVFAAAAAAHFKLKIYSHILASRWRSCGKSRSQQGIKAIYPSTLRMICAVLIGVIFCSSMADG